MGKILCYAVHSIVATQHRVWTLQLSIGDGFDCSRGRATRWTRPAAPSGSLEVVAGRHWDWCSRLCVVANGQKSCADGLDLAINLVLLVWLMLVNGWSSTAGQFALLAMVLTALAVVALPQRTFKAFCRRHRSVAR